MYHSIDKLLVDPAIYLIVGDYEIVPGNDLVNLIIFKFPSVTCHICRISYQTEMLPVYKLAVARPSDSEIWYIGEIRMYGSFIPIRNIVMIQLHPYQDLSFGSSHTSVSGGRGQVFLMIVTFAFIRFDPFLKFMSPVIYPFDELGIFLHKSIHDTVFIYRHVLFQKDFYCIDVMIDSRQGLRYILLPDKNIYQIRILSDTLPALLLTIPGLGEASVVVSRSILIISIEGSIGKIVQFCRKV